MEDELTIVIKRSPCKIMGYNQFLMTTYGGMFESRSVWKGKDAGEAFTNMCIYMGKEFEETREKSKKLMERLDKELERSSK